MAATPSIEAHLVQLHKCLRLPAQDRLKTEERRKFSDLGLTIEKHRELADRFMNDILSTLDLDPESRAFVLHHFLDWANLYKAVQLHTWTGRASFPQVIWHFAANFHAPSLGRYLAFWAMDGALGQGMPGGRFWFLPSVEEPGNSVHEPIPKVLDWLLDLYGAPAAQFSELLGEGANAVNNKADSFARNLSNWRKNPPYARTIEEMFPDRFDSNDELRFQGTFEVDVSLPIQEQADAAREFVRTKKLTPEILRDEIPMTGAGRIEEILHGDAAREEIERFVSLLRERYARPKARLIRQRFLAALMCQQVYRELCHLFGGSHGDGDMSRNKVLQLTGIVSRSYNLTIEARNAAGHQGESAEDRYFSARLLTWEALGPFMSVLPSLKGRPLEVASRLNRIFVGLEPKEELKDVIPNSPDQAQRFDHAAKADLDRETEEIARYKALKDRAQRSSAWRALQGEVSFDAVQNLVSDSDVGDHVRLSAARRLRELASTPDQAIQALVAELQALLDAPIKSRPPEAEDLVAALLDESKVYVGAPDWQAPLLTCEAKHLLAQNRWPEALQKFRRALDACSATSFGPLRGEVARDAWSLALAMDRLQADQEKFYRNMLDFGVLEGEAADVTMEDVALLVAEHFWKHLYKPYPTVQRKASTAHVQAGAALEAAFKLILAGRWNELHAWFKENRKLQRAHLKDVRGDTVLTLWLKMHNTLAFPAEVKENLLHAVQMLVAVWPGQANLTDFKGQTPLMLAANAGLHTVVSALLKCPEIKIDAQDFLGRTALHSAVTGHSKASVRMLLDSEPNVLRVTQEEGQTVLHTAVRMGCVETVAMIQHEFPSLREHANAYGRTPAAECQECLQSYERFAEALAARGRTPPSTQALRSISGLLAAAV